MLASVAAPRDGFHDLAHYLIHGRRGAKPDPRRVAWIRTRNLMSDDPEIAATIMTATAKLSARTKKPVYHTMISWSAEEAPSPEIMQLIAGQALDLMGLGEHQSLIVGHGDTACPHLHMMINRVHPETGKAWRTAHDYLRFDRVMKQLAEEHGFTYAPSRRFALDEEESASPGRKYANRRPPSGTRNAPHKRHQSRGASDPGHRPRHTTTRRAGRYQRPRRTAHVTDLASHLSAKPPPLPEESSNGMRPSLPLARNVCALSPSQTNLPESGGGAPVANLTAIEAILEVVRAEARIAASNRRSVLLVDAVDIVRALATWGLADREDVRAAIETAVQDRSKDAERD